MRTITPLNYGWRYGKKTEQLLKMHADDSHLPLVDIPHSNAPLGYNNYTESIYQFESIYRKKFTIQKKNHRRYFIRFEGVLHRADVYLNDQYIGRHDGGYTAFEFEVTEHTIDGENTLIVSVDSRETLNIPPFGKTIDYLTYGGIYREVYWIETPEHYIKHVHVTLEAINPNPTLSFDIQTSGGEMVTIHIEKNGLSIHQETFKLNDVITMSPKIELWDIDAPHVYGIKVVLDHDDVYTFNTGFKVSEFKSDGFYLNDKKIKIIGLNRHQIYPYVGYAMPKNGQIEDAKLLKSLGNAVRTSHYPQSKHFLDACDRLGILVFTEAPGWQYVGDVAWQASYLQQVQEMIQEQQHHPSIVLWGVRVNESGDYNDLYQASNALSKSLDDRQTGGVRCFSFSKLFEDVYTYNDFFHNGTNDYMKSIDDVIKEPVPYLITEFNGHMFPTKSFDTPTRKLEHALRYAHILDAHLGHPRVSGSFGWQFVDYNTHEQFGSGDHICYHGVYDAFRLPKPAAHVYLSQQEKPHLCVLNSMDIGDYDAGFIDKMVIATNCDYVEVYQNDRNMGKFYPDKKTFPHLKHPPIIVDDFYGDAYDRLNLSKETIARLKTMATDMAKRGGLDKMTSHDHYDPKELKLAWQMYGQYVANWGAESFTYTILGYHNGSLLKQVLGPYHDYAIDIHVHEPVIEILDTYDVCKIDIQAIDNLGNLKPYAFDVISIETNGVLEVIGESVVSLIGGKRSIWVRSIGIGIGTVKITHRGSLFETKIIVKQGSN
jgi:beta-galactosidase